MHLFPWSIFIYSKRCLFCIIANYERKLKRNFMTIFPSHFQTFGHERKYSKCIRIHRETSCPQVVGRRWSPWHQLLQKAASNGPGHARQSVSKRCNATFGAKHIIAKHRTSAKLFLLVFSFAAVYLPFYTWYPFVWKYLSWRFLAQSLANLSWLWFLAFGKAYHFNRFNLPLRNNLGALDAACL